MDQRQRLPGIIWRESSLGTQVLPEPSQSIPSFQFKKTDVLFEKKSSERRRALPHLTREKLLPTPIAEARSTSLRNHLALVALRQGEGNGDLLAGLLRTVYLTYFVLDSDDTGSMDEIALAERALRGCVDNYSAQHCWQIPEASCVSIEAVLRMHDRQLAAVPVHRLEAAGRRLSQILATGDFPQISPAPRR
jgi:hypothetical protein